MGRKCQKTLEGSGGGRGEGTREAAMVTANAGHLYQPYKLHRAFPAPAPIGNKATPY